MFKPALAGFLFAGMAAFSVQAQETGKARVYYIAAETVAWDYAPNGMDLMMGHEFTEDQAIFVTRTEDLIGSVYSKSVYVGYTDAAFTQRDASADPSNGLLGPIIHAEVGDTITVNFRNNTPFPASVHPHGVFYEKDSEGAMTNDETTMAEMADDSVPSGGTHVYTWQVPERAGPGPNDGSSVVWLYHSHVDEIRDTNSGLIGAIVVTAAGMANEDGTPNDVDREVFSLFSVMNENESLYLDDMMAEQGIEAPGDIEAFEEFEESNLMHAVNGYVFGNQPMPQMTVGERVRWYVMALGTEVDLHTPHWHGNTALINGHRKDVAELLPATTLVADMVPDNAGIWMFHCHVNDHIAAGMTARYEVAPKS
jgi:FtsP/CotA-like multicopper oxidase with cupredoxin domain